MKTLIINADDLGYDPAVTRGIVKAMREGVVSSTTFMVNTPFSREASLQIKGLSVGLHLNLARHEPLSDEGRRFTGGEFVEANAASLPSELVAAEVLAQLDRLASLTGRPATHVDVHKHLHQHANVMTGLLLAGRQRGLPVRSINPAMRDTIVRAGVKTNQHFIGDAGQSAYWTIPELEAQLRALPDGVTEAMCHPGYAPSHTRSGYSEQREVELATFVHPRARELLAELNVTLTDFRAVG